MKCPRCGAEIGDGKLYCEKCGEEIHMVPDFEPEIEYSMNKTLSGIVEDVLGEVREGPSGKAKAAEHSGGRRSLWILAVCLVLAAVAAAAAGMGAVIYRQNNSADYQASRAEAAFHSGDVETAVACYVRALELEPDDLSYWLALADIYGEAGMEEEYLACLDSVIHSPYITEDWLETAYKKLIAYYRSREDYVSINALLVAAESEAIRSMFQSYMAAPPGFSYKEGTYAEVVPLKLTASTQGTIYYTMDGTIPDESSEVYTTPIFLETGSYTISAMFVNEYGIESEVVTRSYVIDVLKPTAPEVETYSGDYNAPTLISVLVPEGCTVYYTTDGTVPTDQSLVYTDPIPMPLGRSVFRFITYSREGVAGPCTTRRFDLELETEYTAAMAVDRLVETLVEAGRITDKSGTIAGELDGRYLCMFQYVQTIPQEGDFYVVFEVYEDTAGVQNKTGTIYAVDVYTLECYRLSRDGSDNYILEAF